MKKISTLLLCILLCLSLFACNTQKEPSETNDNALPLHLKIMNEKINNAWEGAFDGPTSTQIDVGCVPFEHTLKFVTDVVKATYKTTKVVNRYYLHCFEIIESLRGEEIANTIYVWTHTNETDDCGCSSHVVPYEKDSSYLLLLERSRDAGSENDSFRLALESQVIPLTNDGVPDIENAKMCSKSFVRYIEDNELKQACENGSFVECLLKKIESNPTVMAPSNFINTTDIKEAVAASEYIFIADINIGSDLFDTPFAVDASCKVVEQIKGDVERERLTLKLPRYAINDGERVLILVNKNQDNKGAYGKEYTLSSLNSIHSPAVKEEIIKILNEAQ